MTEEYYWDYCNTTTAGQYLDLQEREVVNEFLNTHTPQMCLDIACGSGRFSFSMMDRGIHIVAADYDPVPLKKLKCKLPGAQNKDEMGGVLQVDAGFLPFQDRTFDCILSLQTVGYLNAQQFFSECNRILKDGGWLLFNEANRHSYKAIIHRKISLSKKFYRHSHSEICSILTDNKFKIERAVGMNWLPIKRDSNYRWTPFASKIERGFGLRIFPSISPWVFYVARKNGHMSDRFEYNTNGVLQ